MSARRLVVATDSTEPTDTNERLLSLVAWFSDHGVDVELVALGDGWARDRFRAAAPLLVVDELRRRGPARIPWTLGLGPVPNAIKAVRLRRWLASRSDRTFLIGHPLAAMLLRYAPHPPRRVVAAAPGPGWDLGDVRPEDLDSLLGAAAWVVRTEGQRAELAARTDAPVTVIDTLVDPRDLPPVRVRPGTGAVVLLTAADPWDHPDHAVEVAWQLHRADPAARFRWVATGEQAAWLARHDVAHAGLGGVVEVVADDDPGALLDVAAVVRTAPDAAALHLSTAAALAGLPVLGWGLEHVLDSASAAPADVEGVVADLLEVRARPERARAVPSLSHLNLDHRGAELVELLFPGEA